MCLHNLGQPEKLFENVMLLRTFFLNVQKVLETNHRGHKALGLIPCLVIGILIFIFQSSFCKIYVGSSREKISIRSSKQILGSENVSPSQTCSAETLPYTLGRNVYLLSCQWGMVTIQKTSLRKRESLVNNREGKGFQVLTRGSPL